MNKKIGLLIGVMIFTIAMTSCVRDEKIVEDVDKVEKIDGIDKEVVEEEILTTEEILDLVLNRDDKRDNYSLEYMNSYYFKSENLDLEESDFEDTELEDIDIGDIEIDQKDMVYHYQDGQGRYKTVLKREENGERKEKIITYNKDLYIVYDSDMVDEGEDSSIYSVWKTIINGEYKENLSGYFVMDSDEDFEDFKTYSKVDFPQNPLFDCIDLLDIYNFSDMYKLKRVLNEENEDQYVLNLISHEENVNIKFYIDSKEFYIKSYEGINGEAKFGGRLTKLEKYVEYDRDFFDKPNLL